MTTEIIREVQVGSIVNTVPLCSSPPCSGPTSCDRSDWLVTAPQLGRPDTNRVPWGTYHIKANGSLVTACGEYAANWHVFWGHPFSAASARACRGCLAAIGKAAVPPPERPR